MNRYLLLLPFVYATTFCFGISGEESRELFHGSSLNEKCLTSLMSQEIKSSDALALAYKGLCTSMMAEYVFFPSRKWQFFKEGKNDIERAVMMDSLNPELRYIRLLLQLNVPSFLGYNDEVESDFNYFLLNIHSLNINDLVKNKFVDNLMNSKRINQEQKLALLNYQCIN